MNIVYVFLEKYHSLNIQVKSALWFTVCSFLLKGISFFTAPIFTRLMTLEQYGLFSLYASWLEIFTIITSLYLFNGVTNNALSKFEGDRPKFIASMQGLTITITTVVMALVFVFWHSLDSLLGLSPAIMLLLFVETYVTPALAYWTTKQRFEYKYKKLVTVTIIKSLINLILSLLAVYYAEDKTLARIIAITVVEVIICGSIMVQQFSDGKVFFDKKYWKYAITLALPLLPHYLAGIILNHGDRIMISKLIGNNEVALYSIAYNVGMVLLIFVGAINSSITPWIYSKLKLADIHSIQKRSCGVLMFIFCIAVGLMLVSPEIILIFGAEKYAAAVCVIPPVASSVFFIFLYNFLSFPEFYFEKTRFLMIASIIAAGLNVLLNFIFIPKFGFVAAAYTTLACYVIYSLGHYIVGGRILHESTGAVSLLDSKFALVLAITIIVLGSIVQLSFDWLIIRYMILALGLAISYRKRKIILKYLIDKNI